MRITYIANHGERGNDEEGAIKDALRTLGHDVTCIQERLAKNPEKGDLLLFHKFANTNVIAKYKCPKAFWYFDLVTSGCIPERDVRRTTWMREITPLVDIGFMTDGDFAKTNSKYCVLHQAADQRKVIANVAKRNDILFTGSSQNREPFINQMARYGNNFVHVAKNLHGPYLANKIAKSLICIAPPNYVTDNYWSNRVYLMMCYGGFVLHPYCEQLTHEYEDGVDIAYYRDMDHMHHLIQHYRADTHACKRISVSGHRRTLREHTYVHRCTQLLATLKARGIT
jgi:hypothetical protein